MKCEDVIIVIPWFRAKIFPDERYALRHLSHYLDAYPKCLAVPEGLDLEFEGFGSERFPRQYFASTVAYNRLCLAREFYERFRGYEYMLIYQLDCLVFSDQLRDWCQRSYDYVGAPLFNSRQSPELGFSGTLNGGLSLRRVSSFLRVLSSRRYLEQPVSFIRDVFCRKVNDFRSTNVRQKWVKRVRVARAVRQGVDSYTAGYTVNEDHFWSDRAAYFDPEFRVAPPAEALGFAFETAPGWCFERNGCRLPFGAHAWQKYDRSFWEPHLVA